jgi:hypothetical protein
MSRALIPAVACLALVGCGSPLSPDAVIEQRLREHLARTSAASADWKDLAYHRDPDGTVFVTAKRTVGGTRYEFSAQGQPDAGYAVKFRPADGGDWLGQVDCKDGKATGATKLAGTDEQVAAVKPAAAELDDAAEKVIK